MPKGWAVGLCARVGDTNLTYLGWAPGGVTETGTITLQRFIDVPNVRPFQRIDCAEPGRCALYLYNPPGETPVPTFALLEFVPLTAN